MEVSLVSTTLHRPPSINFGEEFWHWSIVQAPTNIVASLRAIRRSVTTGLHNLCKNGITVNNILYEEKDEANINFAAHWPFTVFIVLREHPDGWPKPIAIERHQNFILWNETPNTHPRGNFALTVTFPPPFPPSMVALPYRMREI